MLLSSMKQLLRPAQYCAGPCIRDTVQAVFSAASVDSADSRASKILLRAAGAGARARARARAGAKALFDDGCISAWQEQH